MKIKYIKELDSVRGIAALSIMWLHFASGIPHQSTIGTYLQKSSSLFQVGVPLFFVLSGFLITRILIHSKTESHFFRNFYARRSLRIFPLYYLVLLIAFFLLPLLYGSSIPSGRNMLIQIFYLQNIAIAFKWLNFDGFNHLWSLAVEEHFYLFWPLIVYYCSAANLKKLIVFILIAQPVLRYLLLQQNVDVFYFTFTRLDELCIGGLIAIMELEGKIISKRLVAIVAGLCIAGVVFWLAFTGQRLHVIQSLKFSLFSIIFYIAIGYIALNNNRWVNKALQNRVLFYTGKISYGLYIYHPICYTLVEYFIHPQGQIIKFVWCISSSYAVASLSYYLYEKQFLRFKKRFASTDINVSATALAVPTAPRQD